MAFRTRADLQNQAIGWLRKGYSSLGGGTVVRFPRVWMASGECRFKELTYRNQGMFPYSYDAGVSGQDFLWVYGFFDYRDFLGKFRRKGFCARWDSRRECFSAERNPDYDYLEDRAGPEEKPDFAQDRADAAKKAKPPNHGDTP